MKLQSNHDTAEGDPKKETQIISVRNVSGKQKQMG